MRLMSVSVRVTMLVSCFRVSCACVFSVCGVCCLDCVVIECGTLLNAYFLTAF